MPPTIKAILTPGSVGFLAACLAIWFVLRFVWPRTRRFDRSWFVLVAAIYLILSMPFVAVGIVDHLPKVRTTDLDSLRDVATTIVLDGDNRRGRVRTTLLVHQAHRATHVIVLGDAWIADALIDAGVPQQLTSVDGSSPTTRAQIAWIRNWLELHQSGGTVVVASRLQMPRVEALFRTAGVRVRLAVSPIDSEPPVSGFWRFIPTYIALRASRDALYEHAALAYYGYRGWIRR